MTIKRRVGKKERGRRNGGSGTVDLPGRLRGQQMLIPFELGRCLGAGGLAVAFPWEVPGDKENHY